MTLVGRHDRRGIELEQLILEERLVKSARRISFLRRSGIPLQGGSIRQSRRTARTTHDADLREQLIDHVAEVLQTLLLSVTNCIHHHRIYQIIVSWFPQFDAGWSV